MSQENPTIYEVYTLIDITKTDVISSKDDATLKKRNQQRNWETITQVLNLRTQVSDITDPIRLSKDVNEFNFGRVYKGKRRVWTFRFTIEQDEVFGDKNDPIKLLISDFEMVPIISNLDESPLQGPPMFVPKGEYKNVHFTILKNG